MTDLPPRAEEGAALFHRAAKAVSAVEGLIGAGMILTGAVLLAMAKAQWGFHGEAVRRHEAAAKRGETT